jgi:hypothetical protein
MSGPVDNLKLMATSADGEQRSTTIRLAAE